MGPADHTEFLGPQIYTLTTVGNRMLADKELKQLQENWKIDSKVK